MGRKPVEVNPEQGKRLKQWIKEVDISQNELAKRTGYQYPTISAIVNGKGNVSDELAKRVRETCPKPYRVIDDDGNIIYENWEYVEIDWLQCRSSNKTLNEGLVNRMDYNEMIEYGFLAMIGKSLTDQKHYGLNRVKDNPGDRWKYEIIDMNTSSVVKEIPLSSIADLRNKVQSYLDFLVFSDLLK